MSPERPVSVNENGSGGATPHPRMASASDWIRAVIAATSLVAHRGRDQRVRVRPPTSAGRGSSSGSIVPALAALSAVESRRAIRSISEGPASAGSSTSTGSSGSTSDWTSVRPVSVDALVRTRRSAWWRAGSRGRAAVGRRERGGRGSTGRGCVRGAGWSSACSTSIPVTVRTAHSVGGRGGEDVVGCVDRELFRQRIDDDQRQCATAGQRGLDEQVGGGEIRRDGVEVELARTSRGTGNRGRAAPGRRRRSAVRWRSRRFGSTAWSARPSVRMSSPRPSCRANSSLLPAADARTRRRAASPAARRTRRRSASDEVSAAVGGARRCRHDRRWDAAA